MSNYKNLSKVQLIQLVEKQEKELKSKKYGLVWDSEREPEQVVLDCENNLPILKRVKGKEIRTNDDEDNILIEGDNYHALTVLNYTHKGKIDVIYIDPPYNTGNKSWKYNNRFVEKDDGYRHSKYLNFIEKRLNIAKKLLSPRGIIICAIDDYEYHNVRHLMDMIFEQNNRLGSIVVVHNPRGRNDDKYFATMHEYMLIYANNLNNAEVGYFDLNEEEIEAYNKEDSISPYNLTSFIRTGNNSKRIERPNLYYPIYYNKSTKVLSLEKNKDLILLLPLDNSGDEKTWRWGKETFIKQKDTELIVKDVKSRLRIFKKRRITNIKGRKPKSLWFGSQYDASSNGIMKLRNIIGKDNNFPYPKSLYTVSDIIALTSIKDSIILDYFAGSGTTGHAVLELNKQDGGNRKFILCTNNENNICEDVTYPRIQKVIKGYKKNGNGDFVEGLGGNLQYFKTSFVKKTKNRDQLKINLTRKCTEILCVKENIFNETVKEEDYKIFSSNKKNKFLCIYYNFLDKSFDNFLEELKKLKGKKIIYMFSLENKVDKKLFKVINNFTIEPIPQKILDVYKQLVKMNK